jgi:hypothetical protein
MGDGRTLWSRGALAEITPSLGDTGGATGAATQVVELGAANAAEAGDFDLLDARGVDEEGALDADAVGSNAADGEVLVDSTITATDYDAFEDLDTLAGTFDDLGVDANGIAGPELRDFLELLSFDRSNQLGNHDARSFSYFGLAHVPAE